MIRHFLSIQFIRFVGAGGTAAALNWLSRALLRYWMPFSPAIVLPMFITFLIYKFHIFREQSQ